MPDDMSSARSAPSPQAAAVEAPGGSAPSSASGAASTGSTSGPQAAAPSAAPDPAAGKRKNTRSRLFGGLAAVLVLVGVIWGLYYLLVGSHYVSTDDAYVGADTAQVTSQVPGQVQAVKVSDTQHVNAGDPLVVIDPADAKLAEAQAEADYGRAIRAVRQSMATTDQLGAQVSARDADLLRAKAQLMAANADVERTKVDLQRRQALAASGAVSGEELTTAKNAYATASANLEATKAGGVQAQANRTAAVSQQQAQSALTEGLSVEQNPQVAAAKAQLDTARLNLERTTIRAPFAGVVGRRNVQVGQRIAVGAPLMSVVPLTEVYVDANFKEVQLRKVKPGQPVELKSDLYGSKVRFHGTVVGFAGGTGSAFAVIPAQNATGNWIKVVQRLPVRIRLDPKDLADHPLRVGLSMDAKIDLAARGER